MEVTLKILADALMEQYPRLSICGKSRQNLKKALLLPSQEEAFSPDTLYCCPASILPKTVPEDVSFVIIGTPAMPPSPKQYLLLPHEEAKADQVFARIQAILLRLWSWYAEVLSISAAGTDFQSLADVSAPLFPEGISLLSVYHNRLFCGGQEIPNSSSRWEQIFRSYYDPEIQAEGFSLHDAESRHRQQGPQFVVLEQGESYLTCNVFCGGIRMGAFVAPLSRKNARHCHLLYMQELASCAERMYNICRQNAEDALTAALRRLLSGDRLSEEVLRNLCQKEGWAATGHTLRIMVIRAGAQERETFHREQLLFKQIVTSIYYKSKALLFQGDIVLVRDFTTYHEFTEGEDSLDKLNYFLKHIRASMGASVPFSQLSQVQMFYEQAKTVAMAVEGTSATCHEYSNYLPYDMIHSFASTHPLHHYIHPEIQRLAEQEAKGNADLLLSLYHYLLHDRSYQLCAERQHIHRNSFAYRIKKVLDTLACDLDDENTRLSLLLSICMYWYLHPQQDPTGISRWSKEK